MQSLKGFVLRSNGCLVCAASLAGVLRTRGFEVTAEAFQKTGQIPDWSAMQRGDFVVEPTDPEVW